MNLNFHKHAFGFDHEKVKGILQLSVSSAQPHIPVAQSSSAGGWYVSGKTWPHSLHLRQFNYKNIMYIKLQII